MARFRLWSTSVVPKPEVDLGDKASGHWCRPQANLCEVELV